MQGLIASGRGSKLRGWLVTILWLVLGALGGEVIIVPGAGDVGANRRMVLSWFSVALAWLLALSVLISIGILTGFIDPGTWPWQFRVPGWLSSLLDPVPRSS